MGTPAESEGTVTVVAPEGRSKGESAAGAEALPTFWPEELGWSSASPQRQAGGSGEGHTSAAPQGRRDEIMERTGIVLTVSGVLAGIGGIAAGAASYGENEACRDCELAGMGEGIAAVSLMGVAGLFVGIGIPLWAVGASETEAAPDDPRARRNSWARREALPSQLRVGARSMQLEWRF